MFEACTARHRGRKCNLDECAAALGITGPEAWTTEASGLRHKICLRQEQFILGTRQEPLYSFHTCHYLREE